MEGLTAGVVEEVKKRTAAGVPLADVVPGVLGGIVIDGGFWRIFGSNDLGTLSLARWNEPTLWKYAWNGSASPIFWGEAVFGNQMLLDARGSVFLWNHENASIIEIGFDLVTVLETSLTHGLGWLDFYGDGSYSVAKDREGDLPIESHLHWVQPRILGGKAVPKNVTLVERVQHLIGHGELWSQLRGMSPGTQVVPIAQASSGR